MYDAAMPTEHWYVSSCFIHMTAIWQIHNELIARSLALVLGIQMVDWSEGLTSKWMLGEYSVGICT
jgi:hypothetical protein